MNELNDYARGMLNKAETFKRASSDDDVQKYYAGKIVAYRNVIKYLQTKQLTIPVVVEQCKHEYDHYTNTHGETVAVCSKCMNAYF